MIDLETVRANRKEYRASTVMLVIANVVPLIGVILWGWSAFNVVILYWLENLIVGGINILKMATCSPDPEKVDLSKAARKLSSQKSRNLSEADAARLNQAEALLDQNAGKLAVAHHASKLFFIPFFTVHYGIFCLVHGVFVFVLLGDGGLASGSKGGRGPDLDNPAELIGGALEGGAIWAALALLFSHLFSFCVNYLGKGEFRQTVVPILMFAPYGRIVVLHVAILFGAFLIMLLGSPILLLVILIAGKTLLDLGFHVWSHARLKAKNSDPSNR